MDEAKSKLTGTYDLVVGANQMVSRKDFARSTLTLVNDGTFVQDCVFTNGQTETVRGEWNYSDKQIKLSSFKDCAGAWPASSDGKATGASLVVELTAPPTILVSPDMNLYYRRQG